MPERCVTRHIAAVTWATHACVTAPGGAGLAVQGEGTAERSRALPHASASTDAPEELGAYGVTFSTITSAEPTRRLVSVRTCTAPRSTRPAAGAALAVTVPGTVVNATHSVTASCDVGTTAAPDELQHAERFEDFVWSLLNSQEFMTNH